MEPLIAAKEAELDKMLDDFRALAPVLRDRANAKMESAQREIDSLKRELRDFRAEHDESRKELTARWGAFKKAKETLLNGGAGRQKTAILGDVVDRIECHFRHSSTEAGLNNGKSSLDKAVIYPATGETFTCFTNGIKGVQG